MSPTPRQSCREYSRRIVDLIDGVDSLESRQRLTAHAQSCERCALELARATELRRLIDSAEEPEISAASEAAFIDLVMAGIDDAPPVLCRRSPSASWGLRVGSAAAAAAAVALLMLRPWDEAQPDPSPPTETTVATLEPMLTAEAESTAESTAELAPEPKPTQGSAAVQFDVGESSSSIDRADFERLLGAASSACSFDPQADLKSAQWIAALTDVTRAGGNSQTTMLRGARELLREDASSPYAPLAARILGKRADLRDRRLLLDTLGATGFAGALALCERGKVGIELLWRAGAPTGEDATPAETQRTIERALILWNATERAPFADSLNLNLNVPLAATLLAQSGPDAAQRLLEQYLGSGDARWRDAWLTAPMSEQALGAALQQRGHEANDQRTDRMLAAIEHAAFLPGLDFAMAALSVGNAAAAATLAALPGEDPLAALMGAARTGHLRAEWEDLAWGMFADRRGETLVAFASGTGTRAADRAAFTLSRLALVLDTNPAARHSLLQLGLSAELLAEHRVRALLLAVEGHTPNLDSAVEHELLSDLRALTQAQESELAAAAWIALRHLDPESIPVDRPFAAALARPGTLAVQHLRVTREVRRARASDARSL